MIMTCLLNLLVYLKFKLLLMLLVNLHVFILLFFNPLVPMLLLVRLIVLALMSILIKPLVLSLMLLIVKPFVSQTFCFIPNIVTTIAKCDASHVLNYNSPYVSRFLTIFKVFFTLFQYANVNLTILILICCCYISFLGFFFIL